MAHCLASHYVKGGDPTTDNYIVTGGSFDVAHSLRADGFDASEDGTGRGTPLVPVAYRTAGDGAVYEEGTATAPLTTATDPSANIIAFSAKDHGADAMDDCSPTLRAGGHTGRHANAGVMPAVACFSAGQSEGAGTIAYAEEQSPTLRGAASGTNQVPALHLGMAVRRLTPRECERLQGFPDDYTLIDYRGKPAVDGPRYKALGNSMAVPVLVWIGKRIMAVEGIG